MKELSLTWKEYIEQIDTFETLFREGRQKVIRELRERLSQVIPDIDVEYHFEHDPFLVLLSDDKQKEQIQFEEFVEAQKLLERKEAKDVKDALRKVEQLRERRFALGEWAYLDTLIKRVLEKHGVKLRYFRFEGKVIVRGEEVKAIEKILDEWLGEEVKGKSRSGKIRVITYIEWDD